MAKAKITTSDIPGVGTIQLDGNIATEETLEELVDAIKQQQRSAKADVDRFNENVDDAADNLDEFSDELERAERAQDRVNRQLSDMIDRTTAVSRGFVSAASSTGSMSEMISSAGEAFNSTIGELVGRVPIVGTLFSGIAQVGFALTSMAAGAIESFQDLNRSIMSSGILLQGGFSGFAAAADEANLPLAVFGDAILANVNRLRLLEGGPAGSLSRMAGGFRALSEAQDENLAQLYALGYTQAEVASGMANVAIAAQRANRNLSDQALAEATFDYMRNLRELSRLTGESVEEIQAQIDANRANLFVQNALLDVAPQQREAAEAFAGSIPDALLPIRDFIVTGQSFTAESGLMVNELSTFAGIYRNAYQAVASGAMDQEQAQDYLRRTLRGNADVINDEIDAMTRAFGVATDMPYADSLGAAQLAIRGMITAGQAGDALGDAADGAGNLSVTMGELQQAVLLSQEAIQSTFVDLLGTLSGDDGMMTRFAQGIGSAAGYVDNFGDALIAFINGELNSVSDLLGLSLTDATPVDPAGYQENSAAPNNPLEQIDPNFVGGAATGEVFSGPETGYLAELHGTEAVVPLPDGRTIPVSFTTSGISAMLSDALTTETPAAVDNRNIVTQSFAESIDNSRSMPELVGISRSMLNQMTTTAQRMEQMIRAMEQGNSINRNAAYARA